ncbi:MAG: sulfatase family protein, partial [Thermoanaerobaculia bacterium]
TRSPAKVQEAIDLYDGEIRQADNAVGELLEQLRKSRLLKNTIVIITADHGEELEDHGRFGHGQTLLSEVTHVPLLIAGPGIPPGRRTGLASLLDVTPTILDYLNIDTTATFDGTTIVPTLADGSVTVPARDLLFHLDYQDAAKVGGQIVKIPRAGLALQSDMQKFVINKNPYQQALFDLTTDPGERRDRLSQKPQIVATLANRLADMYNAFSHRRAQRVTVVASNETRRAVLALGYLSGADQAEPRNIPPGIQSAGTDGSGALGWMGAVHGCVTTNDPDDESQLLKGWSYAEKEGRWTEQEATAVVAADDRADLHLTIAGINHRPDSYTLTIAVDGTAVIREKPAPGPFRLTGAVPPSIKGGRHVITISTDSAFQPSLHGSGDTRRLGVFVNSICIN